MKKSYDTEHKKLRVRKILFPQENLRSNRKRKNTSLNPNMHS